MALRTVLIRVVNDPDGHTDLIHRFRNFGEDVYRHTRDSGQGAGEVDIDEVDAAMNQFSVHRVARVQVRRLVGWLEKEAARQNLLIAIEVT